MNTLFTLSTMAQACGATLVGNSLIEIKQVIIDSRNFCPHSLFVALPGTSQNGHTFVPTVLSASSAAVINTSHYQKMKHTLDDIVARTNSALLIVKDSQQALFCMAKYHLATFGNLTRIAITGSNGKTTTKELVASILRTHSDTYHTRQNFNSALGVSLAVFELNTSHRYAVFEAGTNYKGEIATIAAIINPHYVIITNIGTAHIGIFKTKRAIAIEKRRLAHTPALRMLWVKEDDPYRSVLIRGLGSKHRFFGPHSTEGYSSFNTALSDTGLGSHLVWRETRITSTLSGSFQVYNLLAAVALTEYVGCSVKSIKKGIEESRPLFGRAEYIAGPVAILQDCYNANPDSMQSALESVSNLNWKGRIITVLGDMHELGRAARRYHRSIAQLALKLLTGPVYFYGDVFNQIVAELASSAATKDRVQAYTDLSLLCHDIKRVVKDGDLLFLKGSRAMQLEQITHYLHHSKDSTAPMVRGHAKAQLKVGE